MDYYVLDKEEDGSKCGMLDLGKCIDGSNDSTEGENVFTTASSGNDSGEGARGAENTSRGSDYHGEETEVVGSEDHIMQFISGAPEVGSTGFRENPDSQMEKSMNECDSATDSMLKEIIDMNVVGESQSDKISQSAREIKEKMVQPVIDQSSTDEDSSKSLVSSEATCDPKKTKTLDDILDDFCDENSDTVTSQTSSTTDTDDSGLLANKNPLFEVDKVEDSKLEKNIQKVATGENKIEDNLQNFVEHEQDVSFQKPLEDDKIEEDNKMIEKTVEEGNMIRESEINSEETVEGSMIQESEINSEETVEGNMIQESEINSKDLQDIDIQKSRVAEDMHHDMDDQRENSPKFSGDDQVNKTSSTTELPQRITCNEESSDWDAEEIPKNSKTEIESGNVPLESAEKYEMDYSEKVESENTNNLPRPDSLNREEEMKNHNTYSPIKKKCLKLARHNINTEVSESHSAVGGLASENSNKRDFGDNEDNARKKLKTDTDMKISYDERGVNPEHSFDERGFSTETGYDDRGIDLKEKSSVLEDTTEVINEEMAEVLNEEMADGDKQIEEVRENCGKSLESAAIGFEVEPHTEPQSENEPLNGLHVEDTEDTSHIIEDASNKEMEILKTDDSNQEKTIESEETPPINSSTKAIEDEDRDKQSDSQIEGSNFSTKETDERQSPLNIKNTKIEAQKHEEKAKITTTPTRFDVSSEEDSSSYVPEHGQETTDDAYADFDEENIENISRTIRSFTNEKLSPKKQEKTGFDQKEESPSKKVIMVKTAPNVEKVKRKLEEILEKSKGEEDAAIAELQRMKKEKTDILNAITTEMEKLKSMLVKGKQG